MRNSNTAPPSGFLSPDSQVNGLRLLLAGILNRRILGALGHLLLVNLGVHLVEITLRRKYLSVFQVVEQITLRDSAVLPQRDKRGDLLGVHRGDIVVRVEADLNIFFCQLLSSMGIKYGLYQDSYLQSGGDIIQLHDKEMNMITVIPAEVDNEDCDAKLEDAMIFFTSNKKKTVQDMKGL